MIEYLFSLHLLLFIIYLKLKKKQHCNEPDMVQRVFLFSPFMLLEMEPQTKQETNSRGRHFEI